MSSTTGHELVNKNLTRDCQGITARCKCGWVSGGHFTSLAASAAFMDHQESCEAKAEGQP